MNEAQQMHDHLMNALLPLIPLTVYQDRRRLDTLAWAIVGLCLTQTVYFSAWAETTQSRARVSRERRAPFFSLASSSQHCACTMVSACVAKRSG